MHVLVLNVGSTSFKYRLIEMPARVCLMDGWLERIGDAESPVECSVGGNRWTGSAHVPGYAAALRRMMDDLTGEISPLGALNDIDAIALKIGPMEGRPGCYVLDEEVVARMEAMNGIAPVHNPPILDAVRTMRSLFPEIPLVGLSESAFHSTIPDYTYTYGVPASWAENHSVRRLGYHGASHRYVSEVAPMLAGRDPSQCRLISAHLGGSSSVCAIRNGRSVDTSMGMSAQSGLENAQRVGELDVFALLRVMDREGLTTEDVRQILCTKSGLAGISGTSGDVRDLISEAARGNDRAQLALDIFMYNVRKLIGAYAAVLGGIDVLAFAGGIGERAVQVRDSAVRGLGYLGIYIDSDRNAELVGREGVISAEDSPVSVVIVRTDEELIVARAAFSLLGAELAHGGSG